MTLEMALSRQSSPPLINDNFTFVPDPSSFQTLDDGTPGVCQFTFLFNATITNISDTQTFAALKVRVVKLTNDNKLRNWDGTNEDDPEGVVFGPRGEGAWLSIPGALAPNESAVVSFEICLTDIEKFEFFVDVHGQDRSP